MDTWEKVENPQNLVNKPSLVYLNSDLGSVFDSQVVHLLKVISSLGEFSSVTLLCGVRNEAEENRVKSSLETTKIKCAFFKSYPNYPFFNQRQQSEILSSLKALSLNENTFFHIRGELLASQALKPLNTISANLNQVVVDIRGAASEELSIYFKGSPLKKGLKQINFNLAFKRLNSYKKLSVVSATLKDYLLRKTSQIPDNIEVVHCLAAESFNFNEEKRAVTREQLGLKPTDRLLVFSSGGAAGWQSMNSLNELVSEKWTILNLSKNVVQEKGIISKFGPYQDVPNYLNAADAAIIFRDKNIVNEVACPVKFCEYVCSGLPVISNDGVQLIVDFQRNTKTGLVIDHPQNLHSLNIEDIFQGNRNQLAKEAKALFGEEKIAKDYLKLYFRNNEG